MKEYFGGSGSRNDTKSHVIQQTSHKRFIEMGVNKDSLLPRVEEGGNRL